MKMVDNHKYVYLIANKQSKYVAHAYSKKLAKGYVNQFDHYQYKKVKNTERLKQFLIDDDAVREYEGKIFMTDTEELYCYDSLYEFMSDLEHGLQTIKENVYYLKLSDKERHQLNLFFKLIFNIITKYSTDDYGLDIINQKSVMKYFIKHVLRG